MFSTIGTPTNPAVMEVPKENDLDTVRAWIDVQQHEISLRHIIRNQDYEKLQSEFKDDDDEPASPRSAALRSRILACEMYLERAYVVHRDLLLRLQRLRRKTGDDERINEVIDELIRNIHEI